MKYLISTFLMLFALSSFAQFSLQTRQDTNYNFTNCERTSEQFDENLIVSNFVFTCPEPNSKSGTFKVLLSKSKITIQSKITGTINDTNCSVNELINNFDNWSINVECEQPLAIPTITLEWTDCTLISTESNELNPEAYILHCEDTAPPNDDYFIYLKNTLMLVDDGNSELREYYGCDINYLDTIIQNNGTDVAFKITCWND